MSLLKEIIVFFDGDNSIFRCGFPPAEGMVGGGGDHPPSVLIPGLTAKT